ncbi:MAG TPA: Dyp-type peroxidase [Kineosporiaceae bacterium]|nr:Dyp-type peroxidase [Kineosporiaceae bacterium]
MTSISRRQALTATAAGGGGVVAGLGLAAVSAAVRSGSTGSGAVSGSGAAVPVHGGATVPFHGAHQAGIDTAATTHGTFVSLDLRAGVGRDAVLRMMRLLTDDGARLTQGRPALGDTERELAAVPARLTVSFGFGPRLFDRIGRSQLRPPSVAVLPAFAGDALQPHWTGGDLLLQICADDPLTVAHVVRMLTKDARAFATVRWVQRGFRPAWGSSPEGTTMRNLMGQVDGTVNVAAGTPEFAETVWAGAPGWFVGGSVLVLRRIRMNLETWDSFDRAGKELVVGRRLDNGAPLTGRGERDVPDLTAVDENGFPVIDDVAHVRLAHATRPAERMLRRGFNYDEGPSADGTADVGLLFAAYQADADASFVPVQRRLEGKDALNRWITHVGSAVFALPPGCVEGGVVGEGLLTG